MIYVQYCSFETYVVNIRHEFTRIFFAEFAMNDIRR